MNVLIDGIRHDTLTYYHHESESNMAAEIIGQYGCLGQPYQNGGFEWWAHESAYVCTKETFAYWENTLTELQILEQKIKEAEVAHGEERVHAELDHLSTEDLTAFVNNANAALNALEDTHMNTLPYTLTELEAAIAEAEDLCWEHSTDDEDCYYDVRYSKERGLYVVETERPDNGTVIVGKAQGDIAQLARITYAKELEWANM